MYWNQLLSPHRVRETPSVEKTRTDSRTPFKKDFDTVCNCSGLRRLQDKAQVFPLEQNDFARTRLTHSIEVMSIAESLAKQAQITIKNQSNMKFVCDPNFTDTLQNPCGENILSDMDVKNSDFDITLNQIEDIPIILKTAALLHDMGNPPFGHLGEQIISDWFTKNLGRLVEKENSFVLSEPIGSNTVEDYLSIDQSSDLKNFEGNAQLLRLVSKLSFIVDDTGMNLSYPVLATFIKYPCKSSMIEHDVLTKKKVGYFTSETELFNKIEQTLGLENCRHPLAYLLEAADDIAYLTADIEDAQKKGLVPIDTLIKHLENHKKYRDDLEEDMLISKVIENIGKYRQAAINLDYPDIEGYIIHRIRVLIKGLMIDAIGNAFDKHYEDIMCGKLDKDLLSLSTASRLEKALREVEKDHIYYCSSIVESKTRAFTIINKLLDSYVIAVLNYNINEVNKDTSSNLIYLSLSDNYRYICEKANNKLEEDIKRLRNESHNAHNEELIKKAQADIIYNKLLLCTDQISGMTDSCAMYTYNTLTATVMV